jgi:hypothetical protein
MIKTITKNRYAFSLRKTSTMGTSGILKTPTLCFELKKSVAWKILWSFYCDFLGFNNLRNNALADLEKFE